MQNNSTFIDDLTALSIDLPLEIYLGPKDTEVDLSCVEKQGINKLEDPKKGSGYRWSDEENTKYLKFLIENKRIFDQELKEKKRKKIHCRLSQYVQSRDSLQCRSHHQKMLKKYGDIDKVILQLSAEIGADLSFLNQSEACPMKAEPKVEIIDYSEFEVQLMKSIWQGTLQGFENCFSDNLFF